MPDFEWDEGNMTKSRTKHGIQPGEVESILDSPVLFVGRIVEPTHDEPRWLLLGMTATTKPVALVFTRRGDLLRPISSRPMRRNERKLYAEAAGS